MTTAPTIKLPTKTELLRLLRKFEREPSKKLQKLREKEDKLEEELDELRNKLLNDPKYKRLEARQRRAHKARWDLQREEKAKKAAETTYCFKLVHLKGNAPDVIERIAKLVGVEL